MKSTNKRKTARRVAASLDIDAPAEMPVRLSSGMQQEVYRHLPPAALSASRPVAAAGTRGLRIGAGQQRRIGPGGTRHASDILLLADLIYLFIL